MMSFGLQGKNLIVKSTLAWSWPKKSVYNMKPDHAKAVRMDHFMKKSLKSDLPSNLSSQDIPKT